MTFVFCTQAVQGGAWNRLVEAVEHLSGEGYRCHLIAYSNPDMPRLRETKNLSVHEVDVPDDRRSSLRFALNVYPILRQIEFADSEKVWGGSFSGNAGLALCLWKYTSSRPISLFSFRRGAQLKKLRMRLDRSGTSWLARIARVFAHRLITRVQLQSSDLLIMQTEIGLRQLQDDYPSSIPNRVEILPNNLNTRWIKRKRADANKTAPPSEDDQFRVCFVGRLEMEKKGVDTLLEAATLLRGEPILFDLVGEGPNIDEAKRYVQGHELGASVRFRGWMENPLRAMKQADLVVVPSRTDPLPNVVLEAFAMEKPVIGSKVDGIALMLDHPDLLFQPGDVKRLSRLIRRASADQRYYKNLEQLCWDRASRYRFDWGKKFESLFVGKSPVEGGNCEHPEAAIAGEAA